jgi:hypothetical protein
MPDKLCIGGQFVAAVDGATFPVWNPHDGRVLTEVAEAKAADVDAAVEAATATFPAWARTAAASRGHLLLKLADAIDAHAEELAQLESTDAGARHNALTGGGQCTSQSSYTGDPGRSTSVCWRGEAPSPPQLFQNSTDTATPMAPTTIKIHPTVLRSIHELLDRRMANARMAPIVIKKMLPPIPMVCLLKPSQP